MRIPSTKNFRAIIWKYYREHGRELPWRNQISPYRVLVSELMLQQTQVDRVVPKFHAFIRAFPNFKRLAAAPLGDVLVLWQGLGYNRRARFLHVSAQLVTQRGGRLPREEAQLRALPGIGEYTARAVQAFAYNQPVIVLETNIRTVFLHQYFQDKENVADAALVPYIEKALDRDRPREWYWALMDYGSALKQQGVSAHRQSAHYTKQSCFQGSVRQVRGRILRELAEQGRLSVATLGREINCNGFDPTPIVESLLAEQLIVRRGMQLLLP